MSSMRAVVWGGWMITVVFVMTAATAAAAGSGPRKLRADPLSALDKHDLIDLLDVELDDLFLVPKVMLQDQDKPKVETHKNRKGGNKKNHVGNTNTISDKKGHQHRNLQAVPSPSPTLSTAAPTGDSLSSGGSSSYTDFSFSSTTSSPTATPITGAPTMGNGNWGGTYGSASPTAAPTAVDVDDNDEDGVNDPREVAAAIATWSGGIKSAWVVTMAGIAAAAVMGIFS